MADIADKIGLKEGSGEEREKGEKTIAERLQPFVDVVAPARWVDVKMPNGKVKRLGPGGRSATTQQTCIFESEHRDGDVAETGAVNEAVTPHGPTVTRFAEPEGWMVISGMPPSVTWFSKKVGSLIQYAVDIDDTIKITLTPSPIGILRTTFLLPSEPVSAMPALYTHIHNLLHPTWFYLSASPYNLHPFLRTFLHNNYPKGTMMLRDASWMDLSGFLMSLTQGTEAYKRERMESLHAMLPKRKVLCVGDSTQSDPEAYGDVYRKYKGWVRKIFIRKVGVILFPFFESLPLSPPSPKYQ